MSTENNNSGCLRAVIGLSLMTIPAVFAMGIVVIVLAPIALCFGFSIGESGLARFHAITISEHHWERSINIEVLDLVSHANWCDKLPKGAENVKRSKKQRGTKTGRDGERQPVYDDWCNYDTLDWHPVDAATKSGKGKKPEPVWPKTPKKRACNNKGCKRPGSRMEKYSVDFKNADGAPEKCGVNRHIWDQLDKGQAAEVERSGLTKALSCRTLRARR